LGSRGGLRGFMCGLTSSRGSDADFACTARSQPIRMSCAIPRASLRSVFRFLDDLAARIDNAHTALSKDTSIPASYCRLSPFHHPIRRQPPFASRPEAGPITASSTSSACRPSCSPVRHASRFLRNPAHQPGSPPRRCHSPAERRMASATNSRELCLASKTASIYDP
jgi:hypothetical protein